MYPAKVYVDAIDLGADSTLRTTHYYRFGN